MPDDIDSLSSGMVKYTPLKSYTFDIAGDLGSLKRAPTLTNLSNTLTISAHGGPLSGFGVDKSATNQLADTVRTRLNQGQQLSVEDIAKTLGPATNDVKRAIIDACYAAGYNFQHLKTLFPNLEQLVAPSTSDPTSAYYLRYLTRPTPQPSSYTQSGISPMFSVTPTSTNMIRQTSDWLSPSDAKRVQVPLSKDEQRLDSIMPNKPQAWGLTNYSSKPALPSDVIHQRLQAVRDWQQQQYSGKHLSDAEFDAIEKEARKRISEAFE